MEIRTAAFQLRPWHPDDVDRLVELSADAGCRARWGIFKEPMDSRKAGSWIAAANHSLAACKLGSWALIQGPHLLGCLNLVMRHLDGTTELLPTLEIRVRKDCSPSLTAQAIQSLMEYGRSQDLKEFYAFLAPEEQFLKDLLSKLGMTVQKKAQFEKITVEVFCLKVATQASAPPNQASNAARPLPLSQPA